MVRFAAFLCLVVVCVAAQTVAPAGQEDPSSKRAREIVDKAVQALGGDAYVKAPGYFYAGRASGFAKGELNALSNVFVWISNDKQRVERAKVPGWVTIFNGDKGWDITYHGTEPLEAKIQQAHDRQVTYSLRNVLTKWIRDPKTIYFFDGEKYAEARQCYSVTLINGNNESATILFDQQSYLPLKEEWSARDPEYHDKFTESVIYDKFRQVQGIQTPFIVTRYKNDEMTGQTFVSEAKYMAMPENIFTPEYKSPAPR